MSLLKMHPDRKIPTAPSTLVQFHPGENLELQFRSIQFCFCRTNSQYELSLGAFYFNISIFEIKRKSARGELVP